MIPLYWCGRRQPANRAAYGIGNAYSTREERTGYPPLYRLSQVPFVGVFCSQFSVVLRSSGLVPCHSAPSLLSPFDSPCAPLLSSNRRPRSSTAPARFYSPLSPSLTTSLSLSDPIPASRPPAPGSSAFKIVPVGRPDSPLSSLAHDSPPCRVPSHFS